MHPSNLQNTSNNTLSHQNLTPTTLSSNEHDHIDDHPELATEPESFPPTLRSKKHLKGKSGLSNLGLKKGKHRRVIDTLTPGEGCYLLALPLDVLHVILARLPPRTLKILSHTCRTLQNDLLDESIWRESYTNRFLYEGASRNERAKREVGVLVQGYLGYGGNGWRKEALGRESMLERWVDSTMNSSTHMSTLDHVHSLSLSYPPYIPAAPKSLVVGKLHPTQGLEKTPHTPKPKLKSATRPGPATSTLDRTTSDSTPTLDRSTSDSNTPHTPASDQSPQSVVTAPNETPSTPTPIRMTHRQKYEAILAATTRPAPFILSASLTWGYQCVVRTDPFSGKASKGFWGPGKDANIYQRPAFDRAGAEPSAIFLPRRSQTHVLWGLANGNCVHTTIGTKSRSSQAGRATSFNAQSDFADAHDGQITDIWMEELPLSSGSPAVSRWVTGGADGVVKYWQLNSVDPKRAKNGEGIGGSGSSTPQPNSVICLFSSSNLFSPSSHNSTAPEGFTRYTAEHDPIRFVRYDSANDVVCGITEKGTLRVWFSASTDGVKLVTIDIPDTGVQSLDLEAREEGTYHVSILVHHTNSPSFQRYDIKLDDAGPDVMTTDYFDPVAFSSPLTCLRSFLQPTPPVSVKASAPPILSTVPDSVSLDELKSQSSQLGVLQEFSSDPADSITKSKYGRLVVAGDHNGMVHIFPWDGPETARTKVAPIRSWRAMDRKITAIDYACGLVAIASCNGYIRVFDPLPNPPELLRTFHATHLNAADAMVAASDDPDALRYTINHIILETDLLVASIGRKTFAWRAGNGKGRVKGNNEGRKTSAGGRSDGGKGHMKPLTPASLKKEVAEAHREPQVWDKFGSPSIAKPRREYSVMETQQLGAMDDLGLEDGDDALQYALMLSREEQPTSFHATTVKSGTQEEDSEAVRAVKAYEEGEEQELKEMLEMIRIAEERSTAG